MLEGEEVTKRSMSMQRKKWVTVDPTSFLLHSLVEEQQVQKGHPRHDLGREERMEEEWELEKAG